MIRNSGHKKMSTVFFNSNSDTIITEAVNLQHISILGVCEDVQHFSQHSYSVIVRVITASRCFTEIHMLQTVAQCCRREGHLGAKYKLLYDQIVLSRKQFAIEHMNIYTFLLRMTDTLTSQNNDLSSWDTLYMGWDSVVGISTCYGLNGPGIESG